jgi:general secretion pathway protein C
VAVLGQDQDRPAANGFASLAMQALTFRRPGRSRPAVAIEVGSGPRALITLVEIGLTLAIALVAARAFWAMLAPLPIAQSPPVLDARPRAEVAARHPFKPRVADAPAPGDVALAAIETSLDLKLQGTWADGAGRGTAIILVAGAPQKVFRIGDDICCGAKLEEVYADRAIISRGGVREALYLPKIRAGAQTAQPAVHSPVGGAGLMAATLQPVDRGDGVLELRLFPGGEAKAFEELGLRPGDILVSVNGAPVGDAAAAMQAIASRANADLVTLSVKRDGVEFPLDVPVADLLGIAASRAD